MVHCHFSASCGFLYSQPSLGQLFCRIQFDLRENIPQVSHCYCNCCTSQTNTNKWLLDVYILQPVGLWFYPRHRLSFYAFFHSACLFKAQSSGVCFHCNGYCYLSSSMTLWFARTACVGVSGVTDSSRLCVHISVWNVFSSVLVLSPCGHRISPSPLHRHHLDSGCKSRRCRYREWALV